MLFWGTYFALEKYLNWTPKFTPNFAQKTASQGVLHPPSPHTHTFWCLEYIDSYLQQSRVDSYLHLTTDMVYSQL